MEILMKINEKYYPIDKNTLETVKGKIANLAKSYTPEWTFNEKDPDIGSTIALVFADMMNDSAHKTNMLLYKYHIELMNMIGLTPKAAVPAKSVVVFSLLNSAPTDIFVKKGTPLLAYPDNEDKLVFETSNSICLTRSQISDIYAISDTKGKIIPVWNIPQSEDKSDDEQETLTKIQFNMFDYSAPGIQNNLFMFRNKNILKDCFGSKICVKFENFKINGIPISESPEEKENYKLGFISAEEQFEPFMEVVEQKDGSLLIKDIDNAVNSEGENGLTLCLQKKSSGCSQTVSISGVTIFSQLDFTEAEHVYVGDVEQDIHTFLPFSDTLTEYRECLIGSEAVFSKKGAKVKIEFSLEYSEKQLGVDADSGIKFKHIMKQPKQRYAEITTVNVQRVIIEYFNGVGWRKLNTYQDVEKLFDGQNGGEISIEFTVPNDIEKNLINAFETYWLRISTVQVDNAFKTPAVHKYPIIKDLKISYRYFNGIKPELAECVSGVEKKDITDSINLGKNTIIFDKFYESRDCVFIGFDAPMTAGPISIYFDINVDPLMEAENDISFEYSTIISGQDFKELKVIDKTEKFKHSGCIVFNPPSDFSQKNLFNRSRYWLKIINLNNDEETLNTNRAIKVNDIKLNAVEVANIQTMEEEEFYIDRTDKNIMFKLSGQNILDAEVFVNEVSSLSLPEKEYLLKTRKNDIIAQTDMMGSYINFFVKWQEIDNFTKSGPNDRHYIIDRLKGEIMFGDAKHGMIPQNQPQVAVKVFTNTCSGEAGNVEIGAINRPSSYINFLESMQNNIPAYAGYNMESINNALKRGTEFIGNRGSLISKADFIGAVKHFSDAIDKVRCEVGIDKNGKFDENKVTIAVLMKEFYKSNEVFVSLRDSIKKDLLERCDISLKENNLELIEPMLIELNIDVWITIKDMDKAFEIQNEIKDKLKKFLHPITGNFDGHGWEIGNLPKENQVYSFLKTLNLNYIINKIALSGFNNNLSQYEFAYENSKIPVFSVVVSGNHHIHVDISDRKE